MLISIMYLKGASDVNLIDFEVEEYSSNFNFKFQVLQKPHEGNFGKFQGSGESRLGGSEKDCYFLKIPKWQHKLVRDYK